MADMTEALARVLRNHQRSIEVIADAVNTHAKAIKKLADLVYTQLAIKEQEDNNGK